jgi:hypothetical protein
MAEIAYRDDIIMEVFQKEVTNKLGAEAWEILGHSKVRWEAILETELDGDVLTMVMDGDDRCSFVIYLPDEVVEEYI